MADDDDRDIIIIEDDETPCDVSEDKTTDATPGSRRREYRQLFAKLRHG
jgi:hypothetical protein